MDVLLSIVNGVNGHKHKSEYDNGVIQVRGTRGLIINDWLRQLCACWSTSVHTEPGRHYLLQHPLRSTVSILWAALAPGLSVGR